MSGEAITNVAYTIKMWEFALEMLKRKIGGLADTTTPNAAKGKKRKQNSRKYQMLLSF